MIFIAAQTSSLNLSRFIIQIEKKKKNETCDKQEWSKDF